MFTFPPSHLRPLWRRAAQNLLKSTLRPQSTATRSHSPVDRAAAEALQAQLNQPHLYASTTTPPTPEDLSESRKFFTSKKQLLLFHCEKFFEFPRHQVPEIAILGRSNCGKSSFINALTGASDGQSGAAHTSKKAGKTKYLQCYAVGPRASGGWSVAGRKKNGQSGMNHHSKSPERWVGKAERGAQIILVDTPGFGFGSAAEQGVAMMKYLTRRKNLRMTYLLLQLEHGIKEHDWAVLDLLQGNGVPHSIILSKIDQRLWSGNGSSFETLDAKVSDLKEESAALVKEIRKRAKDSGKESVMTGDVFACSSRRSLGMSASDGPIGIEGIRWAMLQAAGWGEPVALDPIPSTHPVEPAREIVDRRTTNR